jgi:hypothetical protein
MKRKKRQPHSFGRWRVKGRVKSWAEECDQMFYDAIDDEQRTNPKPQMRKRKKP